MEKESNYTGIKIIVHSGVFHADDVYSTALMALIAEKRNMKFIWCRVPDAEVASISKANSNLYDVIVADIGGGEFDHHQENAEVRPDGAKYAAFGLLFREFGSELIPDVDERAAFDKTFIEPLDLTDNFGQGKYPNERSLDIADLNTDDPRNDDKQAIAFSAAVDATTIILRGRINAANALAKQKASVKKAAENASNRVVVLDAGTHLPAFLFKDVTNIQFIIGENPRGGFSITSVDSEKWPIELDRLSEELKAECTFVHAAKFMAVFKTQPDAIKAANLLVKTE